MSDLQISSSTSSSASSGEMSPPASSASPPSSPASSSSSQREDDTVADSVLSCTTLPALVAELEEAFAYPRHGLLYEQQRIKVASAVATVCLRNRLDTDAIEAFLLKSMQTQNSTLLKSIFSSAVGKEDQELTRAT